MTWRLGSYRVEDRPFARGASAEVFRARDRRDGVTAAIKILRLGELDPDVRARAEREAEHSSLDHPHLVRVRERLFDERQGVVGLVMDFAEGGDLRAAYSGPSPPSSAEVVGLVDDILAGLGALHAAGVVHRDVKPENVLLDLVDGSRRARLGDLGIARAVDRTRSTGSVLGTDLYIAPEVHDGGAPSTASDIWAVGYVLYEGLFGGPPHANSATAYQAIGRLRSVGPDRPPAVPDGVWTVVAALLAPDPAQRPSSTEAARALLASLRSIVAVPSLPEPMPGTPGTLAPLRIATPAHRLPAMQLTLGASPIQRVEHALPRPVATPRRARPRLAGVAAVLVVVAAVAGTFEWVGDGSASKDRRSVPAAAVRSLVPLSSATAGVIATQYQWRLDDGTLTGHLEVTNSSQATTAATAIPELFPAAASRSGRLIFTGPAGVVERQDDGSLLLRFAVPPLAPGAHHTVRFTVDVPSGPDPTSDLARLARERDAAIERNTLARSDTPTLDVLEIKGPTAALKVGERVALGVTGRLTTGDTASPELLHELRWGVVEGTDIVEVVNGTITARRPGPAIVTAAVGAVQARFAITVVPPLPTQPVKARQRRTRTTVTVIIEQEHENPPPPHESFVL